MSLKSQSSGSILCQICPEKNMPHMILPRGRSFSLPAHAGKDRSMNNILGISKQKQAAADRYLKTAAGSVLAFTKMLEAIAAGACIIMLVFVSAAVSKIVQTIALLIEQALNFILPAKFAETLSSLIRFPMLIPVIILLLIVLDGIGVMMMRYAGSGEGLVMLVHRIRWIGYLLEIIALIMGTIRFALGLADIRQAMGSNESFFLPRSMGILFWIWFLGALAVLLFFCAYHHDICIALKAVSPERRSEDPVAVGKNRLSRRSGWMAFCSGCYFVFSAIFFIYPLLTKTDLIPDETMKELTNIPGMVLLGGNMIISLISFAKYLSLRICAGFFQKVHKR